MEQKLVEYGLVKEPSKIAEVLLVKAIESERWRKWMVGEQVNLTVQEILNGDKSLQQEILDIAGHYTFNDSEVKSEIEKLYSNLNKHNIDGKRYVSDHIKRPIRDYAECYNLKGVTTRIKNIIK